MKFGHFFFFLKKATKFHVSNGKKKILFYKFFIDFSNSRHEIWSLFFFFLKNIPNLMFRMGKKKKKKKKKKKNLLYYKKKIFFFFKNKKPLFYKKFGKFFF